MLQTLFLTAKVMFTSSLLGRLPYLLNWKFRNVPRCCSDFIRFARKWESDNVIIKLMFSLKIHKIENSK